MSTPVIPEILAEHFETFARLWELWRGASTSPDCTLNDLRRIEERLDAHLDGLRVGREQALSLARERLLGDDPAESFAAAYFMLLSDDAEAAEQVVETFQQAEGVQLVALREALVQAPSSSLVPRLRELLASGTAPVAVSAAEILAVRDGLDPTARRLQEFFFDENPHVRASAWRVAAILDSAMRRGRVAPRQETPPED